MEETQGWGGRDGKQFCFQTQDVGESLQEAEDPASEPQTCTHTLSRRMLSQTLFSRLSRRARARAYAGGGSRPCAPTFCMARTPRTQTVASDHASVLDRTRRQSVGIDLTSRAGRAHAQGKDEECRSQSGIVALGVAWRGSALEAPEWGVWTRCPVEGSPLCRHCEDLNSKRRAMWCVTLGGSRGDGVFETSF